MESTKVVSLRLPMGSYETIILECEAKGINSVGFTSGALQIGVSNDKKVIVVDPNPSLSFIHPSVDLIKMTATEFCKMYF